MFYGTYSHTIDSKGRLIIPAKFRSLLGERFVIARILDKCIWIFPQQQWLIFENKLKSLPLTSPKARAFFRYVFSTVEVVETDRAGRILIPYVLREHASLKEEVIIVGCGEHIEIWDRETWEKCCGEALEKYNGFFEDIQELEIK